MTDAPRAGHPSPEELQRLLDDATAEDRETRAALAAHVAACAPCGEALARLRRVDAALALGSRSPDALTARIRARRDAGERLELPLPAADGAPDEVERRTEAELGLTSAPPDDLLARIRARRAAGDRVILPLPPSAADAAPARVTPMRARRDLRTPLLALVALAAGIVLVVRLQRRDRGSVEGPRPPMVALPDSGATRPAPTPDSAAPAATPRAPRPEPIIPSTALPELTFGFEGRGDAALELYATVDTTIAAWSPGAVDSAARAAAADSTSRVRLRIAGSAAAPDSGAESLARRALARLRERGIAAGRITVVRSAVVQRGAVRLLVVPARPR